MSGSSFLTVLTAVLVPPLAAQRLTIDVPTVDRDRVLSAAHLYLHELPVTITAFRAARSSGSANEFFSEGDYWWPDSANPDGPYVQRDGMTNPGNFTKHREVMIRLSRIVSALAAAYRITGDDRFARRACEHLRAWFVDSSTMMYPHMVYAQAIKGRVTGRGIGIIDTIHLIEVARSVEVLARSSAMERDDSFAVRRWFAEFLRWLTSHKYGLDEREARNNHGTWWVAQVATFAHLTGDTTALAYCRERFMSVLVPGQIGMDGSFPLEVRRTKPYNYSIFNLDGMTLICQILSSPENNLWDFELPDGRGVRKAVEYLFPYLKDKSAWPYPRDVMYFEHYPPRLPSLLFAGIAYGRPDFIDHWRTLEPDPENAEVQRNFPIRQPVIWMIERKTANEREL